jgi:phosphoserine phosphatase RsbU/P
MMPEMDGIELSKRMRAMNIGCIPTYIILLTARNDSEDIVKGLEAGANDYVTKPFNRRELQARIRVGTRVVDLQKELYKRAQELQEALSQIRMLQKILPICSYCKKIRDEKDSWHSVENYITSHTNSQFSHGVCPECFSRYLEPELDRLETKR